MQRRSVRSLMKTNSCPCPRYGRSMLKVSNSPYWKRPQYKALTAGKWDIIIIMLGTNDAAGLSGPMDTCIGPTALKCPFAQDYVSMIEQVKTLGTTAAGPKIYTVVPPPMMRGGRQEASYLLGYYSSHQFVAV